MAPVRLSDAFDLRVLLESRLLRDSLARLDRALHAALYARAELPQTSTVVAALLLKSDRYTRVQLSSDAARRRAGREHAELIELARQGRVDEACAFLASHIEAVRADLLRMLARPAVKRRAAQRASGGG